MSRKPRRKCSASIPALEPLVARVGTRNPERIEDLFWHFKVAQELATRGLLSKQQMEVARQAWKQANKNKGISDGVIHPLWSFRRHGQTQTTLPDGRMLFVAGEHEDAYDRATFSSTMMSWCWGQDGRIEIFAYPESIFPPTDFHSATLIGAEIIMIGSLGYPGQRRYGSTQVVRLDTKTLRVSMLNTTGEAPGWTHKHEAERSESNGVSISGGVVLQLTQGRVAQTDNVIGLH
jgi:hypothetical protein